MKRNMYGLSYITVGGHNDVTDNHSTFHDEG
jgi:hypothetical protein